MKKIMREFTRQQIDYIASAIDDWYLGWKHSIADGKQHYLGVAKEQLKAIFCDKPYDLYEDERFPDERK